MTTRRAEVTRRTSKKDNGNGGRGKRFAGLRFEVVADQELGEIRLQFPSRVGWISMKPADAARMGRALVELGEAMLGLDYEGGSSKERRGK